MTPPLLTIRGHPQILEKGWKQPLRSWWPLLVIWLYEIARGWRPLDIIASTLAVVVVLVVPYVLGRVIARIVLTGDTLDHHSVLRRREVCERSAIARVVQVSARLGFGSIRQTQTRCLDADGVTLVTIRNEWWRPTDLERLWAALGLSVVDAGDV